MNDNILSVSGRTFHKFIAYLTDQLSRPKTKFIRQILCGVLFSENLILTKVASKVPHPGRLTASFVPAREKFCPSWWLRQAKTAQLIPNTSLMRGAISKMGHHKKQFLQGKCITVKSQ